MSEESHMLKDIRRILFHDSSRFVGDVSNYVSILKTDLNIGTKEREQLRMKPVSLTKRKEISTFYLPFMIFTILL